MIALRLLPLAALLLAAPAAAQDWAWVQSGGGSGSDSATSIAADAAGNVYVAGAFEGTVTFGPFTLTSDGALDTFVVKYSPDGEVLWARSGGGSRDVYGRAVAVGADGSLYLNGFFWGTATFGAHTIASVGSQEDLFLVKYSPDGDVLWAQRQGGDRGDSSAASAGTSDGDLYVAGRFGGTSTFGDVTLTSVDNSTDCLLVKYTAEGEVLWARSGGGTDSDKYYGAAADADGNAFAVGFFGETATFGPFTLTSAGFFEHDAVLAKYSPDGDVLWVRGAGGVGNDFSLGASVDGAGDVYIVGSFEGTATFETTPLTSNGDLDLFVAKYSSTGDLVWVRGGGGAGAENGRSIAVDAAGNAYATGNFQGVATFGPHALSSAGGNDVFLVKYSPDGEVLWARSGGGTAPDLGTAVSLDGAGNALLAGYYTGTSTFGPYALTSTGGDDAFVAKVGGAAPVSVAVAPADLPVVIPPEGGAFTFTVTLTNTTGETQAVEAWTAASGAASREPAFGPRPLTLDPGETLTRTLTQEVPANAPAGTYAYHVRVGPYPVVRDESAFAFVKEAAARTGAEGSAWSLSGWDDAETAALAVVSERGFALSSPRPNPFASASHLTLDVAETQRVIAEVYDALGRRVARLHDGVLAAGSPHAFVVEAGALPPGPYVVRVTGERFAATRRITLVR